MGTTVKRRVNLKRSLINSTRGLGASLQTRNRVAQQVDKKPGTVPQGKTRKAPKSPVSTDYMDHHWRASIRDTATVCLLDRRTRSLEYESIRASRPSRGPAHDIQDGEHSVDAILQGTMAGSEITNSSSLVRLRLNLTLLLSLLYMRVSAQRSSVTSYALYASVVLSSRSL